MKSQHGDFFNHDSQAERYDENVLNEANPIRAGYDATLDWVIEQSGVTPTSPVLDLGCGTGNLSARLPIVKSLTCVDISEKMMMKAKGKLAHLNNIEFIQADILPFVANTPQYDAIISTYTVHHLTEAEKTTFFRGVERCLKSGGRATFGDLMFANQASQDAFVAMYQAQGNIDMVEDIAEEFFWLIDKAEKTFNHLGLMTTVERFSDLSWGISAQKR
ncbi:MAG: class I SAM-dependent methyltransferase [Chloroflexota bacterium]